MRRQAVGVLLGAFVSLGAVPHFSASEGGRGALVGAWRLVSTEQRMTDGTIRPSPIYGAKGVGYLIYSASGSMCAVLADPTRPRWKSEDEPTPDELRFALDHFVAYCGRYEVNEAEGFVIHHVEIDLVPNSSSAERKRYFQLDGNRLKLRPSERVGENIVEYTLTWERVPAPGDPH
jgi:hypothetical protein